ncbi:MAG TPA: hypothetical protein VGI58_14295 [Streptosporangiaceae bacterium]|jgi:hypothetical protein
MNSLVLDMAHQYQTEQRDQAAQQRLWRPESPKQLLPAVRERSLRTRTGWTLVHLGLRLAVPAGRRAAVTPRPVRP